MATTITVPSGTGSTSVALTFATSNSAALAQSVLASVYAAAAAGTLSPASEFVVTTPGAYTVPAGVSTVVDAATGPTTITGNGNYSVVAGSGSLDFISLGGSGALVAGAGADTFSGSNYTLSGDDTITAMVGGTNVITGPAATVFGSTGTSVFDNVGSLVFINSGASTVVGSSNGGAATLFGGSSAFAFFQANGTAPVLFSGGSGSASLVSGSAGAISAFGGAGGVVSLFNAQVNTAFNYLIGGAGAETLNAAAATGPVGIVGGPGSDIVFLSNVSSDTFMGGTGSATVVGGTTSGGAALPDLYSFSNGSSGGNDVIFNFGSATDLVFQNYGAAGNAAIQSAIAAAGSGSTVSFTLPDSTKITLVGINGATINPSTNTTTFL
jgi:hypothetical protein